jgi:hypothetical protein
MGDPKRSPGYTLLHCATAIIIRCKTGQSAEAAIQAYTMTWRGVIEHVSEEAVCSNISTEAVSEEAVSNMSFTEALPLHDTFNMSPKKLSAPGTTVQAIKHMRTFHKKGTTIL